MPFTTLQYKKLSMYPFYYPYATPYCYNQFPSYHFDFNNVNQFYALAQQIILEQRPEKNEEINTSYSVNGSAMQQIQPLQKMTSPPIPQDFLHPKEVSLKNEKRIQKRDEVQFKAKPQTLKKQQTQRLRYVNKNFESNIINKIFSFLWSEDKSKIYVNQILKDKTKALLYYDYIKIVRKYCKRYINKDYLQNLCDYQPQHIAYRIVARHADKCRYFTMQELSSTIRKLIFIYLKDVCALSILTSKKMRTDIWRDHFEKARNIYEFLFEGLSSEQYDERMSHGYDQIYVSAKNANKSEQ